VASPAAPVAAPTLIHCWGHGGCTSYSCGGCTSYSCGGCVSYSCGGYSCGGCSGYRHCIFGHHCHGLFGFRHSCYGCGGCTGYSCSGASCFGSCTGYSCTGCVGYGCGMSWGGPVYMAPSAMYGTVTNPNPTPAMPPVTQPDTKKDVKDGKMGANIRFQLPATAKLYVDGRLTSLTGTERSFVTPSLGAGKFFYEVKAELLVDGQVVTEQKRVIVEAGSNLVESFPKLFAAIEGKGDAVAGK
jgi:uncharacterized protein (TIGR03000 family)